MDNQEVNNITTNIITNIKNIKLDDKENFDNIKWLTGC